MEMDGWTAKKAVLVVVTTKKLVSVDSLEGPLAIPVELIERPLDEQTLVRAQIERVAGGQRPAALDDFRRQLLQPDARPLRENDGALDRMLQLADVAGPCIPDERGHGVG